MRAGLFAGGVSMAAALTSFAAVTVTTEAFAQTSALGAELSASADYPVIMVPEGYKIEKVADKLTYATAVTWDDEGRMYVAEAGGAFLEEPPPARILRVEADGTLTEFANLDEKGITAAVTGLLWHDGYFYFTHRAKDLTGAVSRMNMDGEVTELVSGIIDSQTDHQPNDIQVGPDGRLYFTSGLGGNSAVMGQDMLPFIIASPETHATACKDIVLTGLNYKTPDFRTDDPGDTVMSGAYVPFGAETSPGQKIEKNELCGGAILSFDLEDIDGSLKLHAWGFRNVIGLAWNEAGEMFATQNGYDAFGSRPIKDEYDPTYRIREGAWYGAPDFSAALEPLDDPKFTPPAQLMAPIYVDGKMQEMKLGFVIDHQASGLEPPDRSLVLGLHPVNSSPSKPDIGPEAWGDMAGRLFVPEWGDMAWVTNAARDQPAGNRIVAIDTETGDLTPFIQNAKPGPASEQEAMGMGIERPFDVKFGPDDAMYIVDYGVHIINMARIADDRLPFEWPPETGAIWKVTRQ